MRYLKILFLGTCFSCLALQCDKDDNNDPPPPEDNKEELPPATQSGENTFGCLVNEDVWRPHSDNTVWNNALNASYGLGQLNINANINKHESGNGKLLQGVDIYINNYFKSIGKFNFQKYSEDSIHEINYARYESGYNNVCQYYTYNDAGYIKITRLDSIENIVSGRFEFTAVNDSCGELDTIRVTDGRFDIKYAH